MDVLINGYLLADAHSATEDGGRCYRLLVRYILKNIRTHKSVKYVNEIYVRVRLITAVRVIYLLGVSGAFRGGDNRGDYPGHINFSLSGNFDTVQLFENKQKKRKSHQKLLPPGGMNLNAGLLGVHPLVGRSGMETIFLYRGEGGRANILQQGLYLRRVSRLLGVIRPSFLIGLVLIRCINFILLSDFAKIKIIIISF